MDRETLIRRCFGDRQDTDRKQDGYPFITISRQTGAGGNKLAEAILSEMEKCSSSDLYAGWKVFDRDLCTLIAEEKDLDVVLEELLSEEYHSQFSEFINDFMRARTSQYEVLKRMFQITRTLTSVGKVVIVGHGSSFVTRDLPGGIHLRLVASEHDRVRAIMKTKALDKDAAKREIMRIDKERMHFVRDYFMHDIDDPLMYDVVWNTSAEPIEYLASTIVSMIKQKADQLD